MNAVRTNFEGQTYDSKLEAKYAEHLSSRLKRREILAFKTQVPIDLQVNGIHVAFYVMDFVVTHLDGSIEWVEVKGFETPLWKLKIKLLKVLYPNEWITVLHTKDVNNL